MGSGLRTRVAFGRSGSVFGAAIGSPSIDPFAPLPTDHQRVAADLPDDNGFREIDCVRQLLSSRIIADAELRATGSASAPTAS